VTRQILVVANETVESDVLHETIHFLAHNPPREVIVVAPAADGRGGTELRLRRCLDRLEDAGLDARGWVGDGDPLQALEDVMRVFAPDEIVIATHPAGRSTWLARDLVGRARARYAQPVLHLVADPQLAGPARRAA